jgi:outer membrane protein assembly factor BamB
MNIAPSRTSRPFRSTLGFALVLGGLAILLGTPRIRAASPESSLVAHWRFSSDRQQGANIKAFQGGPDIVPSGRWKMIKDPAPHRIELPGEDERLIVESSASGKLLPALELTLESWVRIDRPQPLGGIFGVVHEGEQDQLGCLLGFQDNHFAFTLATESHRHLSQLKSPSPFEPGRWYHVVGTYDGQERRLYVNGYPANRATDLSGPIAFPTNSPVVFGAYPSAKGSLPTRGAIHEVRVFRRSLTAEEIARRYDERKSEFPEPAPLPLRLVPTYGPFVEWTDRSTARVLWETEELLPTHLDLTGPNGEIRRFESSTLTKQHAVLLDRLTPDAEYFYRIVGPRRDGREVLSARYLFDTTFYYHPARPTAAATTVGNEVPATARVATDLLNQSGVRRGWCLVAGASDGRLALELVRNSDLEVVVIDPDPARIQDVRRLLDRAGVYGVRASAQVVPTHATPLPFGDHIANLVVSESALHTGLPPAYPAAELHRLLRPAGGRLLVGSLGSRTDSAAWTTWASYLPRETSRIEPQPAAGAWIHRERPPLPGAGEWSHQYGNADNTSTSLDERVRGELQVAWWGDPGPRPMPDRGPRNPSPVSVGGRLFIQGDRILFGLDAYNGAILWHVSAPEIRRANLPRDCSNMAGSGDTLYVAEGRYCLAFDGATGQRRQRFEVPALTNAPAAKANWGYLATIEHLLIGSRVKQESQYLGDDGEWYEDYHPDQIARVTSEALFGLDRTSGEHRWTYRGGAILNSTITIGDGMIFFIESRNPAAMEAPAARLAPEILTQTRLVALDLRSGAVLWEKPQDFSKCEFMTYLVYSRNTVVVTGTDRDKVYHTYAFNAPAPKVPPGDVNPLAAAGQMLWSESHKEDKGHHSGHLQHPVVIDGVFYSDQRSFDLVTGKTLRKDLPERRGCGTMSAARHALFFRHHYQAMWDLDSDKRTQFQGIRAGCWLSMIPAGGMLLAPETSAGCSCTHAIQTSVGYLPKSP